MSCISVGSEFRFLFGGVYCPFKLDGRCCSIRTPCVVIFLCSSYASHIRLRPIPVYTQRKTQPV